MLQNLKKLLFINALQHLIIVMNLLKASRDQIIKTTDFGF